MLLLIRLLIINDSTVFTYWVHAYHLLKSDLVVSLLNRSGSEKGILGRPFSLAGVLGLFVF